MGLAYLNLPRPSKRIRFQPPGLFLVVSRGANFTPGTISTFKWESFTTKFALRDTYSLRFKCLKSPVEGQVDFFHGFTKGFHTPSRMVTVAGFQPSTVIVGGFNPFEKYSSKWESSPSFGMKIKKQLKPPPRVSPLSFEHFHPVPPPVKTCQHWNRPPKRPAGTGRINGLIFHPFISRV